MRDLDGKPVAVEPQYPRLRQGESYTSASYLRRVEYYEEWQRAEADYEERERARARSEPQQTPLGSVRAGVADPPETIGETEIQSDDEVQALDAWLNEMRDAER